MCDFVSCCVFCYFVGLKLFWLPPKQKPTDTMQVSDLVSSSRQFVDELEKYRSPWESKTHWHARKTFLRHNWESMQDKERLICLSTAWANVHFMENRYPQKVMLQLREMEKGMDGALELLKEAEKQVIGNADVKEQATNKHSSRHLKMPRGMLPVLFVNEHSSKTVETSVTKDQIVKQSCKKRQCDVPVKDKNQMSEKIPAKQPKLDKHITADSVLSSLKNKTVFNQSKDMSRPLHQKGKSKSCQKSVVYKVFGNSAKSQSYSTTQQKVDHSVDDEPTEKHVFKTDFEDLKASTEQTHTIQQFSEIFKAEYGLKLPVKPVDTIFKLAKVWVPVFRYSVLTEQDENVFNVWTKKIGSNVQIKPGTHVCEMSVKDVFIAHGYGSSKGKAQRFAIAGCVNVLNTKELEIVCAKRLVHGKNYVNQLAVTSNTSTKDLLPPICSQSPVDTQKYLHGLGKFVVRQRPQDNAIYTINQSAQFNNLQFDYRFENYHIDQEELWDCVVVLNHCEVGFGTGPIQKCAKLAAAENALNLLQKHFPTVLVESASHGDVNQALSRDDVIKSNMGMSCNKISEDNVGNQLLRKMGWSGTGGLGKNGAVQLLQRNSEGREEPVQCKETHGREGLGKLSENHNFVSFEDASRILQNYATKNSTHELTFSPELTNEERKTIHMMARKFGLSSKSFGKGETRYLTVFRKVSADNIVTDLWEAGGSKYGLHLLKPGFQS
uniref:Uncharacterized protein LOC100181284 n=1 Tax=Phallusia mammillata TaxID=59560 RepID=A0A6F9DGQ1_9ASCI|nr:uncharacterized protein LOC100181284 [Phallusia mammillata]